jgi:GNAT superfamily N-acetyltransferase
MVRNNPGVFEEERGGCVISTDPAKLDLDLIHEFLSQAYWCEDIPRHTLERAIRNSLCFGIYADGRQVGFARVITDRATFAYLADVFVLESHRCRGLSKHMMEFIMAHPDLQGLRRWSLATRDAHGLYSRFGFTPLRTPERHMEIINLEIYKKSRQAAAASE